jgi:hypothetical protein
MKDAYRACVMTVLMAIGVTGIVVVLESQAFAHPGSEACPDNGTDGRSGTPRNCQTSGGTGCSNTSGVTCSCEEDYDTTNVCYCYGEAS